MATKSIGATGRDYATLALWSAYVNALVGVAVAERGECYNDSEFVITGTVTFGGWTLAGGSVTLTCGSGQSFRDNAGKLSNALRYNVSNGVGVRTTTIGGIMFRIQGDAFTLDGLQVYNNMAADTGDCFYADGTITARTIQNCIFQGRSNSTADNGLCAAPSKLDFQNNLVLITAGNGSALYFGGATSTCTDNTVVNTGGGSGNGIDTLANDLVAKNNATYGFGANAFVRTAGASSSNNATDQASFGGTNWGGSGQTSLVGATEWISVTSGSEDFRVNGATSVKLKSNGATTGPSTDIVGSTRTAPYTIGAWQVTSSDTTITPSVGTLAITGQAPVVTRTLNSVITPSVGALAITGLAPVVTATINRFAQPSAGTLTLTGQDPIVTTTSNVTQLGISVGSPSAVGGIECYTSVTHVRAGMGTGGIEAILYTAP